jgi:hypothetical protein
LLELEAARAKSIRDFRYLPYVDGTRSTAAASRGV